jgi:hypothetical protein
VSLVAPRIDPTGRGRPTERDGRRWRWAGFAAVVAAALTPGCDQSPNAASPPPLPAALQLLVSGPPPPATDTFEVWVCLVPDTTTDPIYLAGGARFDLTPDDIVRRLEASVPEYFADLSGGAYRPRFVAGGELVLEPSDDHQHCIDRALDRSTATADAVYVVADAEHGADQPGGLAQQGVACACPAATSRRMVYVGASDFHADWGPTPAVDLTEHEIGHTLGLPHSTDERTPGTDREHAYTSALDVMSNSAAPRDVDPARRHAPATIAANLLALGWLPTSAVAVVPADGAEISLTPSDLGTDLAPLGAGSVPGTKRAAVVGLDEHRLLTAELLVPTGYDDHLPKAGIAVHLIDQSPSTCGHADGAPCTGLERRQIVLGNSAPHTDLLTTGEHLEVEGWRIDVAGIDADGASATLALRPTQR